MGLLVSDTFTALGGTDPHNHRPEIGGPWIKHPNVTAFDATKLQRIDNNRLHATHTSGTSVYTVGPVPAGPDQRVVATINIVTRLVDFPGVVARCDVLSTSANTMYVARANVNANTVELIKIVNGTATTLANPAFTWAVGLHTLIFDCTDAAKTVTVDGTQLITNADNAITAPGAAGVRIGGATGEGNAAGGHIEDFQLVDLTVISAPVPPAPVSNRLLNGRSRRRTTVPLTISALPGALDGASQLNSTPFILDGLWTDGGVQYAVWANQLRNPMISKRTLPNGAWATPVDLSTVAGNPLAAPAAEDPHNVFQLAVSTDGYVHVAGNLHDDPIHYCRTTVAGDLSSFATASMSSTAKSAVTYPTFVKRADGVLLCFWRLGSSGNGDLHLDVYNATTHTWTYVGKIIDGITTGDSPYWNRPAVAPDGTIHLFYCFRGTGNANTNNDICHIKSANGGSVWTDMAGNVLTLPITHATSPLVLDTAATGSGLLNTNGADVDTLGHPHAAFLLYDGAGKSQVHHVYHDGSAWHVDAVTSLTYTLPLNVNWYDPTISRPDIVCDAAGRTFVIYRTNQDGKRGRINVKEVTPGAASPLGEFAIWQTDTHYHETVHDHRALKDRDELHVLMCAAAPVDPANPDWSRKNWRAVQGRVISAPMSQMAALAAA